MEIQQETFKFISALNISLKEEQLNTTSLILFHEHLF